MTVSIKNKNVLVTGANRGIGKAIVEEAIERGAKKVYAAVRSLESAKPLVAEFGERVVPIQVDLEKPETIAAAAKKATDVDIVVNNAGVLKTAGPLDDHVFDSLEYEMRVNVYGLLHIAKSFAPVLAKNGGGALAQLNSVVSVKNFADVATYSASKAASYSLTQALREKLKVQGTHVVSVHPGPIKTDMADAAGLGEIAEPPSLVAKAIFDAIENKEFHVWPDSMAKQFGDAYQSFASSMIEAEMQENPA